MPVRDAPPAIRVIATVSALDATQWPRAGAILRLAPDEVLVLDPREPMPEIADPHAIVFDDEGWVRYRTTREDGVELMAQLADWPTPETGFAQGRVGGIATKVVVRSETLWFVVPATFAHDFGVRIGSDEVS